jgi:arylformamidase
VVIKKPESRNYYDVDDFNKTHIKGKAVLLYTGLSKYFGTAKYSENPPYLSVNAAKYLVAEKVALVGIDGLLVDDFKHNETIPIHNMLLGHGIVIAEDMANIDSVIGKNAYLTAVPPRAPMTSFPTRIFATVY